MQSITESSYHVEDYTTDELYSILRLDPETATSDDIVDQTDLNIQNFYAKGKTDVARFYEDIQTTLLQLYNQPSGTNTYDQNGAQASEWTTSQALTQEDTTQTNKITQRKQKVDVFDNESMPMKREQLGISNQFEVPVAQDTLNPNLQNAMTRTMNLDSQYRYSSSGAVDSGATDYTLVLSDSLTNVLSMRLYSFQIPFTWYAIDVHLGNTCMWVRIPNPDDMDVVVSITIPPGNYTQTSFVEQFHQSVLVAGLVAGESSSDTPIHINANNGKVTITLLGWTYNDIVIESTASLLFFDDSGEYTCTTGCSPQNHVADTTLGWLMGFREWSAFVTSANVGEAVIDLAGPKYFILAIDDFNQNHINNGLVTIGEVSTTLKMPSYYNTTQPYICTEIAGSTRPREVLVPSAPRTITQAQLYTINEIIRNRENTTRYRGRAPAISDTFSILPVKRTGLKTGDMYVDFSGSLQDNKRTYFGPVDINRLRVRLLDDRGNVVNLNGLDWCVTILVDILYQY